MLNKIKTALSVTLFAVTVIVGAVTIVSMITTAGGKLAAKAVENVYHHKNSRLILVSRDDEGER